MFRAPKQTLLLCVVALAVNAAASEFRLFPMDPPAGIFAGNSQLLRQKCKETFLSGNLAGALKLHKLSQQKFPHAHPGVWAAGVDLLINQSADAAALLQRIADDKNNPERFAAMILLAENAVKNRNWLKAYSFFSRADQNDAPPVLRLKARTGTLYSLLRTGSLKESAVLLQQAAADFPEGQELWEKFGVNVLGANGDFSDLEKYWEKIRPNHPHAPEELLFDGLFQGAEAAAAAKVPGTAEKFYADSFNYAVDDAGRRNSLRKLMLLQAAADPRRALNTIDRFLLFFPRVEDTGSVRVFQGVLYSRLKEYLKALGIFRSVLENREYRAGERLDAALQAAAVSEKLGDLSMARELYNSAARRFGENPAYANLIKTQLLEFLVRTKDYSPAVLLGEELAGVKDVDQDKVNLLRLRALIELKRYSEASVIAKALSNSNDPENSAAGIWHQAHLSELQGSFSQARELYLEFVKKYPDDKRVPEAMLAAADFAVKRRDFQAVEEELKRFLEKFPGHAGRKKALSAALFAALHRETPDSGKRAVELFEQISAGFPESTEYDQAVLELCRYYFRHKDHPAALKLLEDFFKKRPASPAIPGALLIAGRIFESLGSYDKTLEYVDRLLDKYPNSHLAVESAMLGGSSCFQSGNYQKALKYYERACELGGRGVISQIAAGEAADCHLMLRKKENLQAAVRIYRELATVSEFAPLQAQALYKLGMAWEYSGENLKALNAYEELLAWAVASEKVRRNSGIASWCARAAHSALRIVLGSPNLPDGSQRAQKIYRLYALLDLPGSSTELRNYLDEIRKHYNLLD